MDGQSIKTATGKEFAVRFYGVAQNGPDGSLYAEIEDSDFRTVVDVFGDEDETKTIFGCANGETEHIYHGYTHLMQITVLTPENNIEIRLDSIG